jgi:multiple sugar transport system permease protein
MATITLPGRRVAMSGLANLVLAAIALFFLAPLAWLVVASITPHADLSISLPRQPSPANFLAVLTSPETLRGLLNGLIISASSALLTMTCSALAAYPLSRRSLRFKGAFLYAILFSSSLPVTAIMVPVYSLFVRLQLVDTLLGTLLFLAASAMPFAIWLTKNFMDGVPRELEEAAWVDGCSPLASLRHVVLPLMVPGLAVIAIFTFITAWGNFYVPFILLLSPDNLPAAVTIYQFFGQHGTVAFGPLAAYSIVYSVPVLLLYLLVSRSLGGAFVLGGAVKS